MAPVCAVLVFTAAVLTPTEKGHAFASLRTGIAVEQERQGGVFALGIQDTIPPDPRAGKVSRRAAMRAQRQGVVSPADTSRQDTTRLVAVPDTLRFVPVDSTARIEQFLHKRVDSPTAIIDEYQYPLYLRYPTSLIRQTDIVDSSKLQYRARLVLGQKDVRVPMDMSFEEYRAFRYREAMRENFRQLAQKYDIEALKKKGLGELFGQFTKIEIPVPKNPIFSIFGPNIIRLNFNGAVDIHGGFKNIKSDLLTDSPLGQTRNEPDFSQEVQINVQGEIGDKLKISADWNTQRLFEYENQLKVKYTGYEDEIIQSVEAGNVSLATRSTFYSSNQALFGIKAAMQFGPLKLTTLASQKKGQIKDLTVSGGTRSQPFERRATDYSRDHYFIDEAYIPWFDSVYINIPAQVNPALQIRDIEVWVTRLGQEDPTERRVVAFIDAQSVRQFQNDDAFRERTDLSTDPGRIEVGSFVRLEPDKDYTFHEYAGYISLNRSLQDQQSIAVAYTIPDPADPTYRNSINIGNFGSRDTSTQKSLIMKLVRPSRLSPQFTSAWKLMLKNIYPLGGRDIKKDGFRLEIRYEVPGQESQDNVLGFNLLQAFKLDRYNEAGGNTPDNKFDYLPMVTINERRGEIIFPTTEPFSRGIREYLISQGRTIAEADSFTFQPLYDTTSVIASQSPRNRFVLKGEITSSISSTYQLGFGNVVEGSVEVIVDGVRATPNVDYTVDYITGQVVIRNQSFLVPGKNLQIRYEANDLFTLASKTLLGARGDIDVGKQSALGFTVLNLNQQTLSDKVRLGEEPISNTIMGIDGSTTFNTPFLTRAINWLPGIRTNVQSSISFSGEFAYLTGDPNTRKSTIPQDNGAGIAYIDDFEGARRTIPIPIGYGAWRDLSAPAYVPGLDPFFAPGFPINPTDPILLQDTAKIQYKSKMIWYNVFPSDVITEDIWPNRSVRRGEEQVTVLNLHFSPRVRGAYNFGTNLEQTLGDPRKTFGGLQTLIGFAASSLIDENINFIEFWVRVDSTSPDAKLNIDLGIINEDVIPNKKLDTEDGLSGGIRTGVLKPGEDVGIDGLTDDQERVVHADFIAQYPQFAGDPAGDNWSSARLGFISAGEYVGINGTEGNSKSEVGRFPDTEDLNRNNVLDRTNSYFNYEVSLDTNSADFKKHIVGGGNNAWYQIRIPLNEYTRRIGDPSFATVEAIRLWMTGAAENVFVRMTEFNLVGNQWEEIRKNDSTFRVTTVNIEDNLDYRPPPGVTQAKDRTRPDENIFLNEQSLALVITGLPVGETRQAVKRYNVRPLDIFNYKQLKMFFHGDNKFRYNSPDSYDLEAFIRFGVDSLNYYEYRVPLRPGWDLNNDVTVTFSDITALKLGRDSVSALSARYPVKGGPPGATYQLRGNPTLTSIRFISIGVENPRDKNPDGSAITGEVWANELRLVNVEDTPGWAYRFESGVKIADVATVNVNFAERDPFFRGLEERAGSRANSRNWALTSTIGFEQFLPETWKGTTLGFTYSHVEGVTDPKYLPGTDIPVEEASTQARAAALAKGASQEDADKEASEIKIQSQTVTVQETYALPAVKFSIPSTSWLITETINRMSFGYTFTTARRRDPVTLSYEQWGWTARAGYGLDFGSSNFAVPFGWLPTFFPFSSWQKTRIYYLPRTMNFSTTFNRSQAREQSRIQQQSKPVVRNFTANRGFSFNWPMTESGLLNLNTTYQVDVQSSLVHFELDRTGRQRSFGEILGEIFNDKDFVNFGSDLQYSQSMEFAPRPVVPPILGIDKVFSYTTRYSVSYGWSNNLQAGALGKTAGWTSTLSISPDLNIKVLSENIWGKPAPKRPGDTTQTKMDLKELSRLLIQKPFFEFERFTFTFTQTNRSQNGGVLGRTGFNNLYARVPFFQESLEEYGPSRAYQLGLSSDPHGRLVFVGKNSFPFFDGIIVPGRRAPNGNLVDLFSQSNRVNARTSRPLWEGARIDISWNFGTTYNVNKTLATDQFGIPTERSRVVTGDFERSFITLPPTFIFKMFRTGMEDVNKKYELLKNDVNDTRALDQKISQAFNEGLEALPIVTQIFGTIFPRANWTFRWDGLEKFPLFSSFAQRVSLDHGYTSMSRRRWKLSPEGQEVTESQQVNYSFAPLVGLSFTFKQLGGGNFGGSFRYSTNTTYDLAPSVQNITESYTSDVTVTANYNKTGFEIPLFGYALSNDLDISFSYSVSSNSRKLFDMKGNFTKDGTPMEGSTRTVMEPRVRYVLSSKVTASVYYKYTKLKPDEGGSKIPGSTTNEAGFDVRIQISQ